MSNNIILKGTCSEEYQRVRDLFESHLVSGKDENAQLCVYVDVSISQICKCVVDLWGSSVNDDSYGPDDLQVGNRLHEGRRQLILIL